MYYAALFNYSFVWLGRGIKSRSKKKGCESSAVDSCSILICGFVNGSNRMNGFYTAPLLLLLWVLAFVSSSLHGRWYISPQQIQRRMVIVFYDSMPSPLSIEPNYRVVCSMSQTSRTDQSPNTHTHILLRYNFRQQQRGCFDRGHLLPLNKH